MTFLFVASQLWRECCRLRHRSRIRRLPPHGWSPFRSCLRLVLQLSGLHLVSCPPFNSRFRTGDLHPTSSRPCRAYHAPEHAIRSEFEINVTRACPVMLDVELNRRLFFVGLEWFAGSHFNASCGGMSWHPCQLSLDPSPVVLARRELSVFLPVRL